MSTPITIFNAGPMAINVTANGNTAIPVAAATTTWAPGTYPDGSTAKLTYSGNANTSDGELGQTVNQMRITVDGSSGGEMNFTVEIKEEDSIKPRDALQLYVFWNSQNQVSWVFLDEGMPIRMAMAS